LRVGTGRNFIGNFPDSLAGRTVSLRLHLSEHRVHDFYLNTGSTTGWAGFGSCASGQLHFFYFNGFLGAIHHFFEIELDANPKIAAARLLSLLTAATAEMSTENIPELRENIIHIHSATAETATETSVSAKSGVAILVVARFFVTVTQDFVGFCSFFKFLFSSFVTRIFIWVIFNSHFSVGFFYFVC